MLRAVIEILFASSALFLCWEESTFNVGGRANICHLGCQISKYLDGSLYHSLLFSYQSCFSRKVTVL